MNNWISTTLKGVSHKIITGPFGSQLHQSDYIDSGIAVIMPQNIEDRYVNYNSIAYISEEDATRLSRYKAKPYDIVYSRRGDVEKHALIRDTDPESFCGTGCFLVRLNTSKVHPEYVSFYLNRPESRTWLRQHAVGSNMPNLNSDILNNVPICYPEKIETQKALIEGISSLDLKIQLNNAINAELENLAKTLYNYWFVQFDFPNAKGKPYRASGGKMEYSDVLKREIPKGWEVKRLGDMYNVSKGSLITEKETTMGNVKVVAAGITFSYFHSAANRPENTITISASGANAGYVNFWREKIFASDCITVRGDDDLDSYLIYLFLDFMQNTILKKATGSAQPHVYPDDIKQLYLCKIPQSKKDEIRNILIPINQKIANVQKESAELIKLRDFLLPLLMNGQVRVGEKSESLKLVLNKSKNNFDENKYQSWLAQTKLAARGNMDEQTLRKMFEAIDENDR